MEHWCQAWHGDHFGRQALGFFHLGSVTVSMSHTPSSAWHMYAVPLNNPERSWSQRFPSPDWQQGRHHPCNGAASPSEETGPWGIPLSQRGTFRQHDLHGESFGQGPFSSTSNPALKHASLPPAITANQFPNRNHKAKYAWAKMGKEMTSCPDSCHLSSPLSSPSKPQEIKRQLGCTEFWDWRWPQEIIQSHLLPLPTTSIPLALLVYWVVIAVVLIKPKCQCNHL